MAELNAEMQDIKTAIILARINEDKILWDITGNNCSNCVCRDGTDLRNAPEDHACLVQWKSSIGAIAEAAGVNELPYYTDPWGSPYVFDENEGEAGNCRRDSFTSAGPDGIYSSFGVTDTDDITRLVSLYRNLPECQ